MISISNSNIIGGLPANLSGGGGVNNDFVIEVDTTQAGSASDTIILPLQSGGTYSGTIDWGDSSSDDLTYANRQHTYAAGGTYTITLTGTIEGFQFNNSGDRRKIIDISNWGNVTITGQDAFFNCNNLDVSATDAPIIATTSLVRMFDLCTKLTSIGDPSQWDLSSVTNMALFLSGENQVMIFNQDLSDLDMSNVQNVSSMFHKCRSFNNGGSDGIKDWDTSNFTAISSMFRECYAFNQPLTNWVITDGVGSLASFLRNARSFNHSINHFDTSNVTSLNRAFMGTRLFNQTMEDLDFSSVINMDYAFYASRYNHPLPAMSSALTSALETFSKENGSQSYSFDQSLADWDVQNLANANMCGAGTRAIALSTANYDATLIGWEAALQAAYPSGAGYTLSPYGNFGTSTYTLGGAADAARTSLISNFGWTITDGGAIWTLVSENLAVNLDASDTDSYSGSGTSWIDLSGNGNNFTLTNGPTFSTEKGGSIVCDGVDDYIQSNSQIEETTGGLSVFCYYKVSDLTQGAFGGNYLQHAASKRPNTGASTSYWQLQTTVSFSDWVTYVESGTVSTLFNGAGSGLGIDQGSFPITDPVSNDQWIYLGFTTDGTNGGEFKMYVDGNEVASDTLTFDINTGADYIRLMSNGWNTSYAVEGSIRNLHIYDKKLSPEEVTQNYNAMIA